MKRKPVFALLAGLVFLTFAGCQDNPAESSEITLTSIQKESSPGVSGSGEASAPQYSLENVVFSENPEIPGSLVVSYPSGMFARRPIWIDPSHIYLEPEENTIFGVIADVENRTLSQTPAFRYPYRIDDIAYGDDFVYLLLNDNSVWKMDENFNPVSTEYYKDYNDFAVYMPSGTIYFFQQDNTEKPVLCRKNAHGQPETVRELPSFGDKDFYAYPQISPSGDKLLFYMVHYEMTAKYIYVYDIKTDTLTDITHQYEYAVTPGFWAPDGMWMGEQPIIFLYHEYDNFNSSHEILYGIPLERKAESFYNPLNDEKGEYNPQNDLQCSLMIDGVSYLDCAAFTAGCPNMPEISRQKIFYFRDNGTYFSYTSQDTGNSVSCPQLSPDYGYLSFITASDSQNVRENLCIIPTEPLWKPLDWEQVQEEMDAVVREMSTR